jgi:glycosyltransferase involved in cell wall biosynthesis
MKMPANPLVSVIIPVYNGAAYLRETMDSVLAQDYAPLEVLVVDDGSPDNSREILETYKDRVTILSQPNQGVAVARNTGLRSARGTYVTFLDQDDLWSRDKTTKQVARLEADPDVVYVLSRQKYFLQPGVERPSWFRPQWLEGDFVGYHLAAMLARREAFDRVGLLDTSYRYSDDVSWFFRAKDMNLPMKHLPEIALIRRVHESNNSGHVKKLQRELLMIVRQSIARQRSGEEDHAEAS